MLCYSYTYDMVFVTKFLKSNVNYIQPQYQLSPAKYSYFLYIAIHRHTTYFFTDRPTQRRLLYKWNLESLMRITVDFMLLLSSTINFLFGANWYAYVEMKRKAVVRVK